MSNNHLNLHSTFELQEEFNEIPVPGDGNCFLHAIKKNLERLGHASVSIDSLRETLGIRELAWTERDDRRGVGEDFEPMILRLSKIMEVSVVLFVYSGDDSYYRYHKGNGTETIYLKLRSRHYTALSPRLEHW
jgi:hypothetical protein